MNDLLHRRGLTLVIAGLGAAVFVLAGLPLPLLLGPMIACLVASVSGAKLRDMGSLGVFMRTFLGVAVGTSITPEVVSQIPGYTSTLLLVPVFTLVIGGLGYILLRRCFGMDHPTAYYGAMPGGLQDMLIFGEEAGGDVRAMSLLHATRILAIVTLAPLLMQMLWDVNLSASPGQSASDTGAGEIAAMVAAAVVGWRVAVYAGLFGASILGPMIAAAILSLSGVITHRPPAEIIWASQFFIGIGVGVKYSGITPQEIRKFMVAGLAFSMLMMLISLGFIEAIHLLDLADPMNVFLSFLPGGQGEMVIIAIIAGADLSFVVCHHLLRLVLVMFLAPVAARFLHVD